MIPSFGLNTNIILAIVLASIVGGAYFYYKDTQSRIETLQKNAAQLEISAQVSQESLELLQSNIKRNQQLIDVLRADLLKAEEYSDRLRRTLQEKDLTFLAREKPGLIERRMNDATQALWDSFASDTSDRVQPLPEGSR